jgi:squalene synthase HpnC
MTTAADFASGKGHTDENFPVASILIKPRYRPVILAFYRFARAADDVADHPAASAESKLRMLEAMRQALVGETDTASEARALRLALAERNLSNQHALDLLEAFRRDVTKLRYASWDELMDYCRYSAMPVGRFVLDVHGESRATWPMSDALCAALQVINHLQDCAKDYRELDRVYIPLDAMAAAGITPEALKDARASVALRGVIRDLAQRTATLLGQSKPFASRIRDSRLGLEVSAIQMLAEDLNLRLMERDPLSERVHHRKDEALGLLARATARFVGGRLRAKTLGAPPFASNS